MKIIIYDNNMINKKGVKYLLIQQKLLVIFYHLYLQ